MPKSIKYVVAFDEKLDKFVSYLDMWGVPQIALKLEKASVMETPQECENCIKKIYPMYKRNHNFQIVEIEYDSKILGVIKSEE